MDVVLTEEVGRRETTHSALADVEFAGAARRVLAAAANYALIGAAIASGVTISGNEFYSLFVVLSVGIVQLGSVVATRNSIGGHVARTLPVSYDGARLHPALFLGRECFGAAGLGVAAWLGQFVAILLRGSFGDVAWLTSRWELNSGFVLGPLPVTFLGIVWFVFVVQQMRQGPYHQAPHDRVARTLVVRLRASGSE